MITKLTLTIEHTVIERAKKYARERGQSLSGIVENYLKMITEEDKKQKIELMPLTKSLKGAFKAPKDLDYKKELSKALADKYL